MTIGQRIRLRREELNMSQDELAKRIGYKSRSSINKIELDLYSLRQAKIKLLQTLSIPRHPTSWAGMRKKRLKVP